MNYYCCIIAAYSTFLCNLCSFSSVQLFSPKRGLQIKIYISFIELVVGSYITGKRSVDVAVFQSIWDFSHDSDCF